MRHGRLCVGEELHLDYFECLEVEFVICLVRTGYRMVWRVGTATVVR